MKVFDYNSWSTTSSIDTDGGNFVGLAIGPESDEGIVRVGGLLLQAGRVLPLRSNGGPFKLERVRPPGVVTSIARLQLLLFECHEELSICVARPNGQYNARGIAITAAGGFQTLITVPFSGRRQARFQLICAAASVDYKIWGQRFNAATAAVVETLLESASGEVPDANNTLAFYLGGTNEAEAWDALRVELDLPTDQTCQCDAETIGELGAF